MPTKKIPVSDNGFLDQLAGLTGLGWTTSVLGFLSTIVGPGSSFVTRLVADPHSLLYVGAVFFLATLGLDRLTRWADRDEQA